jgi:hypothetical protein
MNAVVVAAEQRGAAAALNTRLAGCRDAWWQMQADYGAPS